MCRVYVRNLEERVKPEPLKEALRTIFSEYGNVIDIVAKTNLKAKGQAFVVFDKPESAQAAIDELQGFELFEKPMVVALARTRSDATVIQTGNEEEFDQHKRRRIAEKGMVPSPPRPPLSSESIRSDNHPLQTRREPSKSPNNKTASSVLSRVPPPMRALPRTNAVPASRLRARALLLLYPTSTCPPTVFSSSRTYPTTSPRTTSLPSFPASMASAKSVLCLVAVVSLSSNTMPRLVLLPQRKTRPAWP